MCKTSNLLSIKPTRAGSGAATDDIPPQGGRIPIIPSAVNGFDVPTSAAVRTTSNNNASSSSHRKKVHFAPHVVQYIFQRSFSDADKERIWYSAVDYRNNRTECYFLNLKINSNGMDPKEYEDKGHSWRGLEHIRQGALVQKVEQRRNTVRAFVYYYRIMGVKDVNALQVFSTRRTLRDRYIAQELASQDFCDACKIYQEHLDQCQQQPNL